MGSARAALPRKFESRSHRLEPRKELIQLFPISARQLKGLIWTRHDGIFSRKNPNHQQQWSHTAVLQNVEQDFSEMN